MNEIKILPIQRLAESQIRGDIPKKCAGYLIFWCIIPDENHTNRSLARLFINDAGDISLTKEDPIGNFNMLLLPHLIKFIIGPRGPLTEECLAGMHQLQPDQIEADEVITNLESTTS
jgi:hypothetical protein